MKVRIPQSGGPGNMNAMLMKAQKMQEEMATLQEDLQSREYTGTAGGGAVTAVVDGNHLIRKLTVNPEIIDPEDAEMLEDLITVAVNEAIQTAAKTAEEEMGTITGGLNLPGMF